MPPGRRIGTEPAGAEEDTIESHAAALEYVDRQIPRLVTAMTSRNRPCAAASSDPARMPTRAWSWSARVVG